MEAEREALVVHLFEQLIDASAEQVETRLGEVDSELAQRVRRLLELDRERNSAPAEPAGSGLSVLLPGVELAGCRLLEPLSAGSSSDVWLARRVHDGRQVAVKFLLDGAPAEALRREQRCLEALNIGGFPRLLGSGELADGRLFLLLDWIPGVPFDAGALEACPRPPFEAAIAACESLGRLHEQALAHGDVKPSHLLLDQDGAVGWIDLGSAHRYQDPAAAGPGDLGSPGWSAPERLSGEAPTPAADVYSLARVLEAAIGMELARNQLGTAGERAFTALVQRATAKKPDDRPADAQALAHELRELVRSSAAAATARTKALRWVLVGGVGALLLLGATLWVAERRRSTEGLLSATLATLQNREEDAALERLGSSGSPAAVQLLLELVHRSIEEGDGESALRRLSAATIDPGDPEASATAALAWVRLGQPARGRKVLETKELNAAFEANPSGTPDRLLWTRALVEVECGHPSAARKLLESLENESDLDPQALEFVMVSRLLCTAELDGIWMLRAQIDALGSTPSPRLRLAAARAELVAEQLRDRFVDDSRLAELLAPLGELKSLDLVRERLRLEAWIDPEATRVALTELGPFGECVEANLALAELELEADYERARELRAALTDRLPVLEANVGRSSGTALRWRTALALNAWHSSDPRSDSIAEALAAWIERPATGGQPSPRLVELARRVLAWARLDSGRPEEALAVLGPNPPDGSLPSAHRRLIRILAQPSSGQGAPSRTQPLLDDLGRDLIELCPLDEPLGPCLRDWLLPALTDCASDPGLLRCSTRMVEAIADPEDARCLRAVNAARAIPWNGLAGSPDPAPLFERAAIETDLAIRELWSDGDGFGGWCAQELLARGAYTGMDRLRSTYVGRTSKTANDLAWVLDRLSPLAEHAGAFDGSKTIPFTVWQQVARSFDVVEPRSLVPQAWDLLQQACVRGGVEHGERFELEFRSRVQSLAPSGGSPGEAPEDP